MYKYLCFVSDDAEEEDYYAEVLKIKSLYNDCRDHPNAVFDETETGQVFVITDLHGDEAKVCIKYKQDKKRIVVMSETYLFDYYDDKRVEEGAFGGENGLSKKTETALKIAFIIVNCAVSYIAGLITSEPLWSIITIAVLAVIYIVSALYIKKKRDISHFKIMSIQLGGYLITVIFAVLISLVLLGKSDLFAFIALFITVWYFGTVISALAVSGAVNGAILLRSNKLNIKSYFRGKKGVVKKIFSDRVTVLSITFFVLNIIIAIICYYLPGGFLDDRTVILSVVLAGIYISSGFLIKKTNDLSLFKILFIHFGGYFASIFIIASSCFFSLSVYTRLAAYLFPWSVMELLICFCATVAPAVTVCGAVMSVVLFIIKKCTAGRD